MLNTVENLSDTMASGAGLTRPEHGMLDSTPTAHQQDRHQRATSKRTVLTPREQRQQTVLSPGELPQHDHESVESGHGLDEEEDKGLAKKDDKELHVTINDEVQEEEIPERG